MRNKHDEDNDYDYSPNELAELSIKNPDKYRQIVESNLGECDTIEKWEQRNIEYAQNSLKNNKN